MDRIFCHFGLFLALLPPPPNDPENQNFEKMKKLPGEFIILAFYPPNNPKNQY